MTEPSAAERLYEVCENFGYYQAMNATLFVESDFGGVKVQLQDADHAHMDGSMTGSRYHKLYFDGDSLLAKKRDDGSYYAEFQFYAGDEEREQELEDLNVVGRLIA